MGGVWPKYYTPMPGSILENDLIDATKLCDMVVVTGSGTGKETPFDKIIKFRETIGDFPIIIGAGLNKGNIESLKYADGAIVGSAFKPGNVTTSKVSYELVNEFMKKINN